jgi:hypothetical protein
VKGWIERFLAQDKWQVTRPNPIPEPSGDHSEDELEVAILRELETFLLEASTTTWCSS